MDYQIMQGDQYTVSIDISDVNGKTITDSYVEEMELIIGCVRKKYPGDIEFKNGKWSFLLTQQESMRLGYRVMHGQVRVKFTTGDVVGKQIGPFKIVESVSKDVL